MVFLGMSRPGHPVLQQANSFTFDMLSIISWELQWELLDCDLLLSNLPSLLSLGTHCSHLPKAGITGWPLYTSSTYWRGSGYPNCDPTLYHLLAFFTKSNFNCLYYSCLSVRSSAPSGAQLSVRPWSFYWQLWKRGSGSTDSHPGSVLGVCYLPSYKAEPPKNVSSCPTASPGVPVFSHCVHQMDLSHLGS